MAWLSKTTRPKRGKPPIDEGWAWMVVVGMFLIAFFLIGMVKCFGIIFAELKPMFQESSSLTAVASTMTLILVPLLSPITTAMAHRFGTRPVVMIGGSVVALAYILTAFATSMVHVFLFYGIVYGIGSAMSYAPALVGLGQYFNKRRALANGIATSGSSIGGMVLAPLIRYLFDTYSFQGTMMILGALLAHVVVGAFLFRPHNFFTSHGKYWVCYPCCCSKKDDMLQMEDLNTVRIVYNENGSVELKQMFPDSNAFNDVVKSPTEDIDLSSKHESGDREKVDVYFVNTDLEKSESKNTSETITIRDGASIIDRDSIKFNTEFGNESQASSKNECKQCIVCCNEIFGLRKSGNSKRAPLFNLALLKRPIYVMFLISSVLGYLSYPVPFVYLPSHAKDLGIDPQRAAFLISIIAISELVARFIITPLADLNKIEKYHFMAGSLVISGVNLLLMPLSTDYTGLAVQCAVLGFFSGAGFITMMPVVLADFLGIENLSSAFGLTLAFSTIFSGGGPPLMGYLKDTTGSYYAAMYVCGAGTFLGGLVLWLKPLVQRLDKKLTKTWNQEISL